MLCYADHHDAAYRWAERRVLERHPRTGAAQLVEVRETVREIEVPVYVPAEQAVAEAAAPAFGSRPRPWGGKTSCGPPYPWGGKTSCGPPYPWGGKTSCGPPILMMQTS